MTKQQFEEILKPRFRETLFHNMSEDTICEIVQEYLYNIISDLHPSDHLCEHEVALLKMFIEYYNRNVVRKVIDFVITCYKDGYKVRLREFEDDILIEYGENEDFMQKSKVFTKISEYKGNIIKHEDIECILKMQSKNLLS